MNNFLDKVNFKLICLIVNHGMASKILKFSKSCGLTGGTIFYGRGTAPTNRLLDILDLNDVRKEIIFTLGNQKTVDHALEQIDHKFKLYKPNNGIAFCLPVKQIIGTSSFSEEKISRGVSQPMYNAIFTIVDKGKAEDVMDAAKSAGSLGGTIINARGSGIHETAKLFNMEISPEKEIVLIISDSKITDKITSKISQVLEIDQPGNGIIFVQDVEKAYGLYQDKEN